MENLALALAKRVGVNQGVNVVAPVVGAAEVLCLKRSAVGNGWLQPCPNILLVGRGVVAGIARNG